jgi:hypothetical protein
MRFFFYGTLMDPDLLCRGADRTTVSFRPPRSKILHSMVITLLVLTSEVMPGLRPAGAAAISTINPYRSAFSAKCSGNWDSDLPFDYSQLVAQQALLTQLVSCEPDLSTDPLKIAAANEKTPVEEFDNQLYRIEDRSGDDYFKRNVLIKELDADRGYSEADSCIYLIETTRCYGRTWIQTAVFLNGGSITRNCSAFSRFRLLQYSLSRLCRWPGCSGDIIEPGAWEDSRPQE